MAQINPWNEIYRHSGSKRTWFGHDWQPNREYMVHVVEARKDDEVGHGVIKIPNIDIGQPTTGTIGWRATGLDHVMAATVTQYGYKKLEIARTSSSACYILSIRERELSPDPNNWTLDPNDDTYEFQEWNTTQGRTLTLNFETGYEYLFVVRNDDSSSEKWYSAVPFLNHADPYRFSSKIHSRMVFYSGMPGWDNWFRLSGTGTNTTTKFKGPGKHYMYRIYRRRIEEDPNKGFYNTFTTVSKFSAMVKRKINISKAIMPPEEEYMFATTDHHGDDELCIQGQALFDMDLLQYSDSQGKDRGFAVVGGRDHWFSIYGLITSSFWTLDFKDGDGIQIYQRPKMYEYVEPDPDPEPEPEPEPEPDPLVPCEDRCLALGETFSAEARVEVNFIDPPDWELRKYSYAWKSTDRSLKLKGTEADGRIGIFQLRHTMGEDDDRALKEYDISVTVSDNDYREAGVQDTDTATLTFELPCLVINNATEFSIDDVSVPECTGSMQDTTARFTVSTNEAVVGDSRTVDWSISSGTADAGADYVNASGTLTFENGDTSKYIDVTIKCDEIPEHNETFTVTISNPSIGTISRGTGTGTIVDDSPNDTQVSLASEGESFNVYIFRDMSGSTSNGSDITLNGVPDQTRDDTIVQILNDFSVPSNVIIGGEFASVSMFTSYVRHVLDSVPTTQKKVSILYITDATDGYPTTTNFYNYSSPSNNHPKENEANTTTITVAEVTAEQGSTWNSTIGAIPSHIEEIKVTVVRILGESAQQSGNAPAAEDGYNGILTTAPSQVIAASFETFSSYTTGEDSVLNDRIAEAVLNTYDAWCAKDPDDTVQVQAADEDEARTKAQAVLNCPDG